jgi:hypothetical protein
MDVDRPVTDYIDAARRNVQGSERTAFIDVFNFAFAGQFRADITAVANPFANKLAAPSTQPYELPAAPSIAPPTSGPAVSSLPAFTPIPVPTTLPSQLSERELLNIGVNDKATEVLLKTLFNPPKPAQNKRLYLCLLQVGCQPGWRTREGYIADVHVTVRYGKTAPDAPGPSIHGKGGVNPGGSLITSDSDARRSQPLVVGVFPSLEAQTLDLQSSLRSRAAVAIALGALLRFGPAEAQASALTEYAKQLERDANTKTAIPIISSYSDGAALGWQIRPAFQAIGNLTASKGQPAEILQPASFPALFLIECDEKDFTTPDPGWDRIVFYVNSRWIPADEAHSKHRWSENDRLNAAHAMDEALAAWIEAAKNGLSSESYTGAEIRRRMSLLESTGLGVTRYSFFPESKKPAVPNAIAINAVAPAQGWRNADTVIAINGTGFTKGGEPDVKKVIVGGVECADVLVLGDGAVVAKVPSGSFEPAAPAGGGAAATLSAAVTVVTTHGTATSATNIDFVRQQATQGSVTPKIDIGRDAQGKIISLKIDADNNPSADAMLGAIRALLEAEKCCDNVKVDISSKTTQSVKTP